MQNKIEKMTEEVENCKKKIEIREKSCLSTDNIYNELLKDFKLLKKEKFFVLQNFLNNNFEIKNLKKKLKNEI